MSKKNSTSQPFVIQNAILSFPNLFQPQQINNQGRAVYSASFLVDQATANMVLEQAKALATSHFVNGELNHPEFRYPVSSASSKLSSTGAPVYSRPDLLDKYVFGAKANEDYPPQVVGMDRQPIIDRGQIYAGCIVAASIRLFTYSYMGKSGISIGLMAVMKQGDGEPLGGAGVNVEQAFANVQVIQNTTPQATMPQGMAAPQAMPQPSYDVNMANNQAFPQAGTPPQQTPAFLNPNPAYPPF